MEIIKDTGEEIAIEMHRSQPDLIKIHVCDQWACHKIELNVEDVDKVIAELVRLRSEM